MIKAIIFDCFGVVITDGFAEAYTRAGGDYVRDYDFIYQTVQDSSAGKIPSSVPVFASRLGITEDEWKHILTSDRQVNFELLEYTRVLKKKYKVAMLTNIGSAGVRRVFDPGLLEKYFDPIVESAQIGYAKPEARAYETAADMIGVRLDECVFVDDRQDYIDGAQAVGMKTVLYKDFISFKSELELIVDKDN